MQRALVMTVIGPDRPGLIDSVAAVVTVNGGNWLESRMSRLGGQFAGILRVEIPAEKEQALVTALNLLDTRGLKVVVAPDPASGQSGQKQLATLDIVGQDRPGIISHISHALASFGVNVEELHSECASGAMSGETIFTARARLSLPSSCNVLELRRTLEKIAGDLIVDLSFAVMENQEV